ncbi:MULTISPECIES: hypothetical protein [Pseudomonas]|uniref:hypothetical protein n=1 Tax=Pseudomonas TaxID=286 RepID=UPI00066DC370|nr:MULTISPECIES: hypothetical protein [Pseudomonas]PYB92581.1 hypothetical protein DMX01_06935 [Pseudomonas fulva]PYC17194.1 hypothetical protein DMX00_03560 [Pseudomonas fulva]CAH0649060.1 hypothetical protein PSNVIR_03330 [Pseudomonas sp. Nvir]
MSDLKKMTLTVKNFHLQASGDLDALYTMVRCEDDQGNTFHFKEVVMLDYLKRHGAIVTDAPRTWFFKHVGKKSIVLVAFEKSNGKVEYDLDHMRLVARSTVLKGIVFGLGSIPAGLIAATATFGLGLLIIPLGLIYGYRNIFKLPKMLRRNTLVNDLASYGVVVK